jgi:hypothetical protein
MEVWNSAMGASLQFQDRNILALSIPDSPIHSEHTLVRKQLHSAQWNKKAEYQILKKIRKPHYALAANLLDDSETTHRLKIYVFLTVPEWPE